MCALMKIKTNLVGQIRFSSINACLADKRSGVSKLTVSFDCDDRFTFSKDTLSRSIGRVVSKQRSANIARIVQSIPPENNMPNLEWLHIGVSVIKHLPHSDFVVLIRLLTDVLKAKLKLMTHFTISDFSNKCLKIECGSISPEYVSDNSRSKLNLKYLICFIKYSGVSSTESIDNFLSKICSNKVKSVSQICHGFRYNCCSFSELFMSKMKIPAAGTSMQSIYPAFPKICVF